MTYALDGVLERLLKLVVEAVFRQRGVDAHDVATLRVPLLHAGPRVIE